MASDGTINANDLDNPVDGYRDDASEPARLTEHQRGAGGIGLAVLSAAALAACGETSTGGSAAEVVSVTPPAGAPPGAMPPGTMPPSVMPTPPAPSPMPPAPTPPAPTPPAPTPPAPTPPAPTPPAPSPTPPEQQPFVADPWRTLNRYAYGASKADLARVQAMGASAWFDEQRAVPAGDDAATQTRLSNARLRIEYGADARWPAVNENRGLTALNKSASQLWSILENRDNVPWEEKMRPVMEVRVATWIRAVHSPQQLRELMAEFWHNHFHVVAESDEEIAVLFPTYDALIRQNAFGNFRSFIEAIARHPCMLFYLDNASNYLSPANENYARELLELHTLGAPNYLAERYASPADVPRNADGVATGYLDADVREVARAFTGWTVANGAWSGPDNTELPDTGQFLYKPNWHDKTTKTVLGQTIAADQPDLADGRQVLDILAKHPGTAQHLRTKLARRLLADEPPAAVVSAAVTAWLAARESPTQIASVVRAIFDAGATLDGSVRKARRPFEAAAAQMRAIDAEVKPDGYLFWLMETQNYRQFGWPAPTGHPDVAGAWLGASSLLARWNAAQAIANKDTSFMTFDPDATIAINGRTSRQLVDEWLSRMMPVPPPQGMRDDLYALLANGKSPDLPPAGEADWVSYRMRLTIASIAMLADFQYR